MIRQLWGGYVDQNLYWKIRMKDTGDLNKDLVLKNKSMIYTQWF